MKITVYLYFLFGLSRASSDSSSSSSETPEDNESSSLVWPKHRDREYSESEPYQAVDLVELTRSLTERFLKPAGNPDFFIRDLFVFRNELQDMLDDIKANKTEALESFHSLRNNDGPVHLDDIRDNNILVSNFNWTSVELKEVDGVIGDTKILWKQLNEEVED